MTKNSLLLDSCQSLTGWCTVVKKADFSRKTEVSLR